MVAVAELLGCGNEKQGKYDGALLFWIVTCFNIMIQQSTSLSEFRELKDQEISGFEGLKGCWTK